METLALTSPRWCWVGPEPASLHVLDDLTRTNDPRGRVLHVGDGRREYLLKWRNYQRPRYRLRATLGRSAVDNESRWLTLAQQADLPVVHIAARGHMRRWGFVTQQALLIDWLPHRTTLRAYVRTASELDHVDAIIQAQQIYVELMVQVRCALLADSDFGLGNILISTWADAPCDPAWLDLEAVYQAPPHHAGATCDTVAAALVSWWVASQGRADWYAQLFAAISRNLPQPACGWNRLRVKLHRAVNRRMAKQLRHGRINRNPPSLVL